MVGEDRPLSVGVVTAVMVPLDEIWAAPAVSLTVTYEGCCRQALVYV